MYRRTKTASVRINLGVITFRSISQKDPSNPSICDRVNCLARYEFSPLARFHYDRAVTLSFSPSDPPTQDTRSFCPLWTRPLKIDETPVDIVEIFI